MSKADEMFERLGYKKETLNTYTKHSRIGQSPKMFFNPKYGIVQIYPYGGKGVDCNRIDLSAKEIKVIYESMKERGYYDE